MESVMMPGYKNALQAIEYGKGYSDDFYMEQAQAALDAMAASIQCYSLGGPCVEVETAAGSAPGFEVTGTAFTIFGFATILLVQRKRKR